MVELRQFFVGLFRNVYVVDREQVGFLTFDEDLEMLGRRRFVVDEGVEKIERVLVPDVVGVAFE